MAIHLATLLFMASSQADPSSGAAAAQNEGDRGDTPWIERWKPETNQVELGVFGGAIFPHPRLELFEPRDSLPLQGFQSLATVAPEVGARFGFFPARFFGLEAEGAWSPTRAQNDEFVSLWTVRGHAVAQLARWSITPFVLAGVSGLGVSSPDTAVGNDVDLGLHFGGGVKLFLNRYLSVRLDVRDTITARRGVASGVVHTPEVLVGFGLTLNRKAAAPPSDRDRDGTLDRDDACPSLAGEPQHRGCPPPDADGDGLHDGDDACAAVPGDERFDGCPVPDSDGDGVLDPDDKCIELAGSVDYEGCPIPDADGDGVLDPDDACRDEGETPNGFDDDDGCPDELPERVKTFTGVIDGVHFDSGKATLQEQSLPKLDNAVAVLREYESVRIRISGHTDDRGAAAKNRQLSEERADSVKAYLVSQGIESDRIETRGVGEAEPRESNATKAGRAENRRIEFELLGDWVEDEGAQ